MAIFYFHLVEHDNLVPDLEGRELRDLSAAKRAALVDARDTLSHDIKEGKIDLRSCIKVEDADGGVVYCIPFKQAVAILG